MTILLVLLSLTPALIGWVTNLLILHPVLGGLMFWLQPLLGAACALWFGRFCARRAISLKKFLLLSQWPALVSMVLYVWQFHFVASEARSMILALLAQVQALPMFYWGCKVIQPFFGNTAGGPLYTPLALLISLLFLAGFHLLGYKLGSRPKSASPVDAPTPQANDL